MEYLPGTLLKTEELTESLVFEIGRCLALIHLNRLEDYGDPNNRQVLEALLRNK